MDLLDRIKELCQEKGISQRRLEQELGLGNATTSKWIKSSPSSDIVEKIADYFNVSIDYLLGRTNSRNLPEEVKEIEEYLFSKNPYRDLTKDEIKQMEIFKSYLISQRNKK